MTLPRLGPATSRTGYLLQVAGLAGLYFVAGRSGMLLTSLHHNISPVWPPAGLALAALLLLGIRVWPGIALGAFLCGVSSGCSPVTAAVLAIGNTLAAALPALFLRRAGHFDSRFERLADVTRFIAAAALGPLIGATLGTLAVSLGQRDVQIPSATLWVTWYLGDLGGLVLLTPLLLTWLGPPPEVPPSARAPERLGLVLAFAAAFVLSQLGSSYYLLPGFPLVVWAALRGGPRGATLASAGVLMFTLWMLGTGGTAGRPVLEGLFFLSGLQLTHSITGLLLAASTAERRRSQLIEREVEGAYRALVAASPFALTGLDPEGRVTLWSRAAETLFGWAAGEVMGKRPPVVPAEREREFETLTSAAAQGCTLSSFETVHQRRDGSTVDVALTVWPRYGPGGGKPRGAMVAAQDISERRRDERLREAIYQISEAAQAATGLGELYAAIHRILGRLMPAENCYVALADPDGETLTFPYWSDRRDPVPSPRRARRGLTEYVLQTGRPLRDRSASPGSLVQRGVVEAIGEPPADWLGVPLKTGDRTIGVLAVHSYSEGVSYGEREQAILEFVSVQVALVTERKRAEAALRASEHELRAVFAAMQDVILVLDRDGRYLKVAPTSPQLLYLPAESLLGRTLHDVFPREMADRFLGWIRQSLDAGETLHFEYPLTIKDRVHWFAASSTPMTPDSVVWAARDVTERKEAERLQQAVWRISETAGGSAGLPGLYQVIHETVAGLMPARNLYIALHDPETDSLTFPYFVDEHDIPLERRPVGAGYTDWVLTHGVPLRHRDNLATGRILAEEATLLGVPCSDWLGVPLRVGDRVIGVLAVQTYGPNEQYSRREETILEFVSVQVANAIERKRAEAALHRSEEQLRQATKMEAVGRLAGGVAHDFNNLLTSVLGHAELALGSLAAEHPVADDLREIKAAGTRAASLTRQLLAFSRKQVLEPRVIDLNEVVVGITRMLRRTIGEDVALVTRLTPGLGAVRADPVQMEQVLINLAVNARDAMPAGGQLTIETLDVDHGSGGAPVVRLLVSDSGLGMEEEVRAHLFEPFFTTKEVGKGTGLGLAMVYGVVQQSGGTITVTSAPGEGTTFGIDLPRVEAAAEAHAAPGGAAAAGGNEGTETVLVAEDEDAVRQLTRRVLEERGYRVLVAASGDAACRMARELDGPIHLLLTDVVMPGLSGPGLAELLRAERPGMRLIFMSGYPATALEQRILLDPAEPFLQKPFTPQQLSRRVREVLDGVRETVGR